VKSSWAVRDPAGIGSLALARNDAIAATNSSYVRYTIAWSVMKTVSTWSSAAASVPFKPTAWSLKSVGLYTRLHHRPGNRITHITRVVAANRHRLRANRETSNPSRSRHAQNDFTYELLKSIAALQPRAGGAPDRGRSYGRARSASREPRLDPAALWRFVLSGVLQVFGAQLTVSHKGRHRGASVRRAPFDGTQ